MKLIHDQPKEWLIKHFSEGTREYPINVSSLMRNIIWQLRERILLKRREPLKELVRTLSSDTISYEVRGQKVLEKEIERYNYHQVHSTIGEIPIIRFERAKREKRSLFRDFVIPSPHKSTKDIFCLRVKRKVDAYHKISISKFKLKVHKAPLHKEVELRIAPDEKTGIAEVRIWYKDILTDVYQVKNSDINLVHF